MFMARCLNDNDTFFIVAANYCKFLINRGYPKELVFETVQPYTTMEKLDALKLTKNRKSDLSSFFTDQKHSQKRSETKRILETAVESPTCEDSLLKPIYLVSRYHVRLPSLKAVIKVSWEKTIKKDPVISKLFPLSMFVVGYRKDANLKDLVSVTKREYEHQRMPAKNAISLGCKKENCKLCKYNLIKDGIKVFYSKFARTNYNIMHKMYCSTTWAVYCFVCKHCGAEYIGSCEQPMNARVVQHLCRMCRARLECLGQIGEDSYIQANLYEHFKIGCCEKRKVWREEKEEVKEQENEKEKDNQFGMINESKRSLNNSINNNNNNNTNNIININDKIQTNLEEENIDNNNNNKNNNNNNDNINNNNGEWNLISYRMETNRNNIENSGNNIMQASNNNKTNTNISMNINKDNFNNRKLGKKGGIENFEGLKDLEVFGIERVVEYLPTRNPFHILYIARARAFMNTRERYWQAAMNLIHTNGLNDSKDFNNLGYFRRNTKKEFIKDFEIFKSHANSDKENTFGKKRAVLFAKKQELAAELNVSIQQIDEIALFSIIVIEKGHLLYQTQHAKLAFFANSKWQLYSIFKLAQFRIFFH